MNNQTFKSYGSTSLDEMVSRMQRSQDSKKRYEYILWLGQRMPLLNSEFFTEDYKVMGCISEVYVLCELAQGKLQWKGYSDALITKGLLAFLIKGLSDLTPKQVMSIDPSFIAATGLKGSLTPSRANGFLNILLKMQDQAKQISQT